MRPATNAEAARLAPAASVRRQKNRPDNRNVLRRLPQWARPRLKSAIVALGVRGLLTPGFVLRLLARFGAYPRSRRSSLSCPDVICATILVAASSKLTRHAIAICRNWP